MVIAHPDAPAVAVYRDIASILSGRTQPTAGIPTPFDWHWANDASKPKPSAHAAHSGGAAEVPVALDRRDGRTSILRWQDDHDQQIDVRDLRLACRCAACVDEMSGPAVLDPATVPLNILPTPVLEPWQLCYRRQLQRWPSVGNLHIRSSSRDGGRRG